MVEPRRPAAGGPPGANPDAVQQLARNLRELKDRSGRTYEGLARRTGMSRSTLHRYSQGSIVPERFAPLEALATACGATKHELDDLYGLWSLATAPLPTDPGGAAPVEPPPAQEAAPPVVEPAAEPAVEPAVPTRRRAAGWRWGLAGALAVVVTVAATVWLARWDAPQPRAQQIAGPTWVDEPQPVPPEFFGVTMNSDTGTMPGFQVGGIRLWDSETRWAQVEPERGRYDWRTLDTLVDAARKAGLPVLFTFGATPAWASPYGPRTAYPDGSRAAPPDDLKDWDDFVRAVTTRYRGKIQAYELWVSAPSPNFYTGTPGTLASMTRRAVRILAETDPGATVVCPSMGELWQPESRKFLTDFAAAGGYLECDVAGVKLHPRDFHQTPESIIELTTMIERTFHDAGAHLRLWSTGTTHRIATAEQVDEVTARNYAVRLFLVGLYARYERLYFYNWGGRKIPIVLQAEGGRPTEAARYVQQLERWVAQARIYSCGHGRDDGLPADVWRCRFKLDPGGRDAQILWAERGAADVAFATPLELRTLSGGARSVAAGASWPVGEEPVLAVAR